MLMIFELVISKQSSQGKKKKNVQLNIKTKMSARYSRSARFFSGLGEKGGWKC